MATTDSLNQSINKAQKHYSSLFSLPSLNKAITLLMILCLIAGFSASILFRSLDDLTVGLLIGITLFAINLIEDFALTKILKDPIFILRRTLVLSLFNWFIWLLFIITGTLVGVIFNLIWGIRLCLLGFAALLTLRAIVIMSVSSSGSGKRLFAILLQPIACVVPLTMLWIIRGVALVDFLPFLAASPAVAIISAYFTTQLINKIGKKISNISSIGIFKAFMLTWVASLNAPLEEFLEKLGEDRDIEVSLLKFDSSKLSRNQSTFIIPLVHPGPFKNIGSSILPSLLKAEFEKEFHCNASVPLGMLGHELDAASQVQNKKIIDYAIKSANFYASSEQATPFVRESEGFVGVSCQVFGKTAFLSFTLAPKTTEDLPQELDNFLREEASKFGFDVIVVNTHNSLTETTEIEASLETLKNVAIKCLKKGVSQKTSLFEVGAASIHPAEFSLKDGMGTGGITVTIVKVASQKTAYVVIDGNNMVNGLREKILMALNKVGFQEGEVFTTDTHSVSAVVLGRRGYHPLGEAMNHDSLIAHIRGAAVSAENKLESSRAGYLRFAVPKVRVIGKESLESLSVLVDYTIQKAKRIIPPFFAIEGLILILLVMIT